MMKTIFKTITSLLLCAFALNASAASTNYTCTISITNAPTGTNGETIVIQGNTYTWTNAFPIIFQIASTNNTPNSATNLFNQLNSDWSSTLRFSYVNTNSIKISTFVNGSLTIALGGNWATNLMSTNIIGGGTTSTSLSVSNLTTLTFTLAGTTISGFSGIPVIVPASTTNGLASTNYVNTALGSVVVQSNLGLATVSSMITQGISNSLPFVTVIKNGSASGIQFTNIQAAINSLPYSTSKSLPGGGEIRLGPGVFNESVTISNNYITGWTIRGAGQFATVWQGGVADGRVITCDSIATNDANLKLSLSDMAIYAMKNTTNSMIYLNHCLPDFHDLTIGTWITATNNFVGSVYFGLQPGLSFTATPAILGNIGIEIAQNQADGGQIYNCNFPGLAIGIYTQGDHLSCWGLRFDNIGITVVSSGVTTWNTNDIRHIPAPIIVGPGGHGDITLDACHFFSCTCLGIDANPSGLLKIRAQEIESCTYRLLSFNGGGVELDYAHDSSSAGSRVISTNLPIVGATNVFTIGTVVPSNIIERQSSLGVITTRLGGNSVESISAWGTSNLNHSAAAYIQSPVPNYAQVISRGGNGGASDVTNGVYNFVSSNLVNGCVVWTNIVDHVALVYLTPKMGSDAGDGVRYIIGTGTNDEGPLYVATATGPGPITRLDGNDGEGLFVDISFASKVSFQATLDGGVIGHYYAIQTNYVASEWAPIHGLLKEVPSNNWMWGVSDQGTNRLYQFSP